MKTKHTRHTSGPAAGRNLSTPILSCEPIGIFHCQAGYPQDAPRQAVLGGDNAGTVRLLSGHNFEQAVRDLDGFSRIWLIFWFNRNRHWKPLAKPPRGTRKVGLFACRSPYRPNPIGISCVELVDICGLDLTVRGHDLLDGTPILDVKPYIPYSDSFPDASAGWLDECRDTAFQIVLSALAQQQLDWLDLNGPPGMRSFIRSQLADDPTDTTRKRVRKIDAEHWEIAYRTWRLQFKIDAEARIVHLEQIDSGYAPQELADPADPYADKAIHRANQDGIQKGF